MPTSYKVGDKVERIEDREVIGATIIKIVEQEEGVFMELEYDEGGSGWWPEGCIRPAQ